MTFPQQARLFLSLQVGGWVAFAAAMSLGRIGELALPKIVALDWGLAAFGFLTTLLLGQAYRRLAHRVVSWPRLLGLSLIASWIGGLAWTLAYHLYLHHAGGRVASLLAGRAVEIGYRGPLLDNTVFHSFILLAWSLLFFGWQFYRDLIEQRERALGAEAAAHQAQLVALRYQLNPHFLFNSLNAISTLVVEGRNDLAAAAIARLSDFLRLTLEGDAGSDVPLAREVEYARRYLAIEELRFGDRLQVTVDVGEALGRVPVPTLILQPLVENAIRHAVEKRRAGAAIRISAAREGGDLLLSVQDNGPGASNGTGGSGTGVGLANVRTRLDRRYGNGERRLHLSSDSSGTLVALRIPLEQVS